MTWHAPCRRTPTWHPCRAPQRRAALLPRKLRQRARPAERMGAFHASQCGYCTPGIVAALGAALTNAQLAGDDAPQPGLEDLARCLDGNLCRQGAVPGQLSLVHRNSHACMAQLPWAN